MKPEHVIGVNISRFLPSREPVAISSKLGAVGPGGIRSVSAITGTNSRLMEHVSRLWINESDIIADVTFGRGCFWKNIRKPNFSHDIKLDGVDCRNLPHGDNSLDVIALDPPYRPAHGSKGFGSNGMAEAYGLGPLDTINDILSLYLKAVKEAFRTLRGNGRILIKCQDISYANRLHLVSLDVLRIMTEAGFEMADQFILVNEALLSSSKWEKQQRARRSHSVLWVGIKAQGVAR